ncbi:peptidase M23B [Tepidicaulis marinus]|uniref:Peptidase M23B n=1 Tax=Tepidicaulis marinus TaxID=1333998 RepID=A0A081B9A4_9HYPH|nr:peptidoglycan DD-metalloendopeptidase family protein [Tepidicaulis marinus]GAK44622.1 peptidase M23B [Tepidicaulis marinus]
MLHSSGHWLDRLSNFWARFYTERQIYLRSHGQVQFISLSPLTQLGLSAIALCFFSWVAFTSVNVVFKEQIIASKDRKYVRMQAAYEERVAQMQSAYDDLNGQLVLAQERFLATTKELESKHQQISEILAQREAASKQIKTMRERFAQTNAEGSDKGRTNKVLMAATDLAGAPRLSRVDHASLDQSETRHRDTDNAFGLASLFAFSSTPAPSAADMGIEKRLEGLDRAQQAFVNSMEETTDRQIREIESVISMTEVVDAEDILSRVEGGEGTASGGPLLTLTEGDELAGGAEEAGFGRQVYRISRNLDRLSGLNEALAKMPLGSPLYHNRITSDFGRRVDPFTRKLAYHSGVDMGAPSGTSVYSTAPGIVTYASHHGAYGRLIEIDHGNGLKTRYAHLRSIHVKVGQKVGFRHKVGRVGSTGRSTGPHVHYEVWFDGKVRDPSKFIEAGRYVFTQQG